MGFYEQFEMLELVRDDGIKTFDARELATGRSVLVHLIVNSRAPLSRALLAKLDRLPEHERVRLVDRGENEGTVYVVTGPLGEYAGFREWLLAASKAPPAVVTPPPLPPHPAPAQSLDDQFASLFEDRTAPPPLPPLVIAAPAPETQNEERTLKLPIPPAPPPLPKTGQ